MFKAYTMNNLEMKILEHRDPSSPTSICVKNNVKPLNRFMVNPQKKEGLMEISLEMQYAPYEGITFTFHRMKTLLNWIQSFVGIGNNLLLFFKFL